MADGDRSKTLTTGARVRITVSADPPHPDGGRVFEGVVMPRTEGADKGIVVVKLDSGYNLAIPSASIISVSPLDGQMFAAQMRTVHPPAKGLPKVAVLFTGGTIAVLSDYRTGAVVPAGSSTHLASLYPELSSLAEIEYVPVSDLLSENVEPAHWLELASNVAEAFSHGARGVVIAHGTDTMAYTANALSLVLKSLPGPVVLTGSQRSSDRPSSDAHLNLVSSVRFAASAVCGEVLVAMHGSSSDDDVIFHKARSVSKRHSSKRDAFVSIGSKPAFTVSRGEVVQLAEVTPPGGGTLRTVGGFESAVKVVWSHPGITADDVSRQLEGAMGAVLLGTGLGHFPQRTIPAFDAAAGRGCMLVMSSQCADGAVNMSVYSTGRDLVRIGVIPSREPTIEATVVRLMWALGTCRDADEARRLFSQAPERD